MVFKAYANLTLSVGGDREACLALDVLLGEVDVPLGCRVDDFNVDTLTGTGSNVGGDDDKGVWVGCVPYALFGRDFSWGEDEFDGGRKGQEKEEEEGGGEQAGSGKHGSA